MTTNDNNAAQTLFRFVSLRNPQLTETKEHNLGFIHKKTDVPTLFDSSVNPSSTALVKFRALEKACTTFNSSGFTTEKDIEEGSLSEMLKIGRKISKRESLSTNEESYAQNFPVTDANLSKLWENLIYQTVTQKDFYVKEAIIHILKAIHFGAVCRLTPNEELTKINGEDLKAKALEARVVLPMYLFGDGDNSGSSSNGRSMFRVAGSEIGNDFINGENLPVFVQEQLKTEGRKITEISTLALEKEQLEQLKLELEKIQNSYYKSKNRAYNTTYAEYQRTYQPILDAYEAQIAAIEARITEEMTQEEIELLYSSIEDPNVPDFNFEYKNELNFDDFKAKLSLDSLRTFVEIFTELENGTMPKDGLLFDSYNAISDRILQVDEITMKISDDYESYFDVFEKLNEEITSHSQTLIEKSPIQEKIYANLGGVLIPVSNISKQSNIISRSYYFKANNSIIHSRSGQFATFYYQAESLSWGLATAKVKAITDLGTIEETYSNISVINNQVNIPVLLRNKYKVQISSLKIQIFFNNGQESHLQLRDIVIDQEYTGILYTEKIKGEIVDPENPENPTETVEGPKPGVFMPKHFGVKRLGVADYLKVVQSVHAYVPGEVSNIENVMASELRHKSSVARDYSEIIDTTSESIETEKISDTTKTDRNEMQSEVAKEIEKQQSFEAHTRAIYGGNGMTFEIGASYANNTTQNDSTRQAVAKSQELTERAMERILTKVNKERVQKIIKEYTETNVHEFDNRGKVVNTDNPDAAQPKHITGVYRWVDKKMKNQIYNYGKRTMFEFMIPEPAKLHRLAALVSKETFIEPVDPRKAPKPNTMASPKVATKALLDYWANIYGVTLTSLPEQTKTIDIGLQDFKGDSGTILITIPDNYVAKSAKIMYRHNRDKHGLLGNKTHELHFSNFNGGEFHSYSTITYEPRNGLKQVGHFAVNVKGQYNYTFRGSNLNGCGFAFNFNCELSDEFMETWKQENFDAIIKAYEVAYADFLEKQKAAEEEAKAKEAENKEKASIFYRDIERVILKHNCIAYLLQDYLTTLGQKFTDGDQMKTFQVYLNEDLEQYTALAKFMEQAFEWSIMDYTFYPYYWADRNNWQEMYLSENTDPLFRSFLQSGMARVIVTVKPGFEDAIQFFMCTGKIWNGGEVPVIGDPMYMSIVDEMREPTGKPQGKYWITRIPTTLTILQAKSVGLKVDEPLPIFPEDEPENCENPKELETETSFNQEDISLANPTNKDTTLD